MYLSFDLVGIKAFSTDLKDTTVTVSAGNTALIPCEPPGSRPDALTVFEINGTTIDQSNGKPLGFLLSFPSRQIG